MVGSVLDVVVIYRNATKDEFSSAHHGIFCFALVSKDLHAVKWAR